LNLQDYENDLEKVIKNAIEVGVRKIIVPGIDVASSRQSIELSEKFPEFIYAAIGIHPNHSSGVTQVDFEVLVNLAAHPNVVAIGEIGLDFYRDKVTMDDQVYVFNEMLSISKISGKPICLHNREADTRILEILDPWHSDLIKSQSILAEKPGVFHSFSGSKNISEWALSHDFFLGISGPVTFSKSQDLQNKIREIDLSHILVETDAPYLSPHPYRGKRNEPSNVRFICEKIAEIKDIGFDEVISRTSENANFLFNWGAF
jgi:TatD DNase family protein